MEDAALYISKIRIQNYQAIDACEILFQKGVNLLIGDNGMGKTSVLNALTVALSVMLSGSKGIGTPQIHQEDIHIHTSRQGSASLAISYQTPIEIECTLEMVGHHHWKITRNDELGSTRIKVSGTEIKNIFRKMLNDTKSTLPLLSLQSASRTWQIKRSDFGNAAKEMLGDRRCGYVGCLSQAMDTKSILKWCLDMELESFQKEGPVKEYELFKSTVATFMYHMNELPEMPKIYYEKKQKTIVYSENGKDFPIRYLSAGYQSLLWMVMDLAYRIAMLNPNAESMEVLPGIVLIDELDMHLHPKWQWMIVKALEKTFPNVQFIVATHSPIVISSCKTEKLIRIQEAGRIEYLESAYGFSVEDVLELRQESNAIPERLNQLSKEFDEAMNASNYSAAFEILKLMKETFGEDNTEVRKAAFELEINGEEA